MSRRIRKQTICICEIKTPISFRDSNCEADQRLWFRYTSIFPVSSHLLRNHIVCFLMMRVMQFPREGYLRQVTRKSEIGILNQVEPKMGCTVRLENKGADQLCGYCTADLRLCFCICKNLVFSCRGLFNMINVSFMTFVKISDHMWGPHVHINLVKLQFIGAICEDDT